MSTGDWNASHYKNPEFDSLAKTYLAAAELAAQRKATKRMAGLLLRDTPVITDYFINYVTASSSKVQELRARGDLARPAGEGRPGLDDDPKGGRRTRVGPPPALRGSRRDCDPLPPQAPRARADHAVPAERDRLRHLDHPPRQRRPGGPRAVRDAGVRRRAQRAARHQPAAPRRSTSTGPAACSTATSARR